MNQTIQQSGFMKVPGMLLLPDTILRLSDVPVETMKRMENGTIVAYSGPEDIQKLLDEQTPLFGILCETIPADLQASSSQAGLTVRAAHRVQIHSASLEEQTCSCSICEDINDINPVSHQLMRTYILQSFERASAHMAGSRHIVRRAQEMSELNELMTFLSPYMALTPEQCLQILSTPSLRTRVIRFIGTLSPGIALSNAYAGKSEDEEADKTVLSMNMEDFIRQMRYVSAMAASSNGSSDEDESEENSYIERILACGAQGEAKDALLEDAKRLGRTNPQSNDAEILKNYLDFAIALPWKKEELFEPDLEEARGELNARHAGMDKVKERIIEHLAIMKLRKSNKGSAILLVGPPGTGKTSLCASIAKALHRPYTRVSLGGVRDEAEIRGHRRTYVGAMSGRILKGMKTAGASNPLMVLDEIDKLCASSYSGDPTAAMLEVLDPEQNASFTDHYLGLPFDLSDVLFIATANSLDTIPAPLLDRMEIISLSSYTNAEKFDIARNYLIPEVLEEHGMNGEQLQIEDAALHRLIDCYTREAGCRGLKKQIARICRSQAVKLIQNNKPIVISEDDLPEIFGPIEIRHEKVRESNPVGVVSGLAWTAAGGEVLFIESASMPGSGQMILTGQLGDVMKESARISYSVLKSRLPLDTLEFARQDIHIHFPAGATPKDGPSAGITILTALASLATGKAVDSHIAMTGELSLSGDVLPIGGLKEKLFGAMRAGITKVLIPRDNERDLVEVDDEIKNALKIIPVDTAEDVLRETLNIELAPSRMPRLAAVGSAALS